MAGALLITANEAAELLGVPVERVWQWAREDLIPCKRLGKRAVYFSPARLAEWARGDDEEVDSRA